MILFSNAILAAEADPVEGTPLTHPRILYENHLRDLDASAVTVSGTADDASIDAPLRPDTFEYWEPPTLPAYWQADMGQALDIDCMAIFGAVGSRRVASEAQLSINGVDWTTFGEDVMPTDGAPLMWLGETTRARFVRFNFTGAGDMPRLAVAAVGEVLKVQRAVYGGITPPTLGRQTVRHQHFSRGGQFLGQALRRMGIAGSLPLRHLTASWYRESFDPFVKSAREFPYFLAWRPETFPLETAYVWTEDDIVPSNTGRRDLMQVDLPFAGVGWD